MNILIEDIIIEILSYVDDNNKIDFLSINSEFHLLKLRIKFTNNIDSFKINHLFYYDNFTNIFFHDKFNGDISTIRFPSSMNSLTFGNNFDHRIDNCILLSVTHLSFGCCFNQKIDGYIPGRVTHLILGDNFNQKIADCIPR